MGACWWEGSEGLLHPLLIQHLQWLSTLSLLAPISLPQVSATIHRPQTVLYPFDSQSQSAAEVNKHDRTSRGQAGHLEAVVLARASRSNARAGPWVTLLSLQMAGDRDFVPLLITWWSGTRKREAFGWSCAQTLGSSQEAKQSCISLQLRAEECCCFVDLAETVLNFGSISYPQAARSQAGRKEPLQGCHGHAHPRLGTPSSITPNTGELYQHPMSLGFATFSVAPQPACFLSPKWG